MRRFRRVWACLPGTSDHAGHTTNTCKIRKTEGITDLVAALISSGSEVAGSVQCCSCSCCAGGRIAGGRVGV